MLRYTCKPRPDFQRIIREQGLIFDTNGDGTPYWDESAYYEFTAAEVDRLEAASEKLQEMCLAAAHWARIDAVFYGASAADAARAGFDDAFLRAPRRRLGADGLRIGRRAIRCCADTARSRRLRDLHAKHEAFKVALLFRLEITRHDHPT